MYILISIFAGAITTVSNTLNSAIGNEVGKFQSVLLNFITGLLVSIIILITNLSGISGFLLIKNVPLYFCIGGLMGIAIVGLSNVVMHKIPVIYASLLIFVGQIIIGSIIDKLLLDSFSIGKIIGVMFISFGLFINILIDKKSNFD